MSTKIYDFYKYTGGDISDLLSWLRQLREKYIDYEVDMLSKLGVKKEKMLEFSELLDDHTRKGIRSPFNIEASVVVFIHKKDLYVQFFGVPDELYENASLIDSHYQNQTDQPEEVSDEEWQQRRKLTDEIFIDGRPSRDGLTFVLADYWDTLEIARRVNEKHIEKT